MNKEELRYKELNTPLVTDMSNIFQHSYGSPDIRGKFDNLFINGEKKKVAPIFSALNAFIITTALAMRMPGQEKIISNLTEEEMLIKIQETFDAVESFFKDPDLKSDLIKAVELYVVNGKFKCEPMKEA
mgnify:CR=1 FL=1|jgi:hypothetical protein